MRYELIQGTDLRASVIAIGTGGMGSTIDRETTFRMLDAYLDRGGNLIDTAKVYADWLPGERSTSEKVIGAWVAARKNRGKVILGTKGAHPDLATMHISRMSPAEIVSDLDASLGHLGVETIDLYWLHRDDTHRPVAEILETLNGQVQAGKIRYFGASNWTLGRLKEAQAYAAAHQRIGFAANQIYWNIGVPDPETIPDKTLAFMDRQTHTYHHESGMAAFAYTSQANGYFNRLAAGVEVSAGLRQTYHLPENAARLERIKALSKQSGLTVSQIVVGYITSQPFPAFSIVGCRNMEQLEDSLAAADVRLTLQQITYIVGH